MDVRLKATPSLWTRFPLQAFISYFISIRIFFKDNRYLAYVLPQDDLAKILSKSVISSDISNEFQYQFAMPILLSRGPHFTFPLL